MFVIINCSDGTEAAVRGDTVTHIVQDRENKKLVTKVVLSNQDVIATFQEIREIAEAVELAMGSEWAYLESVGEVEDEAE
jgi:DNA-directed RNA polymerase